MEDKGEKPNWQPEVQSNGSGSGSGSGRKPTRTGSADDDENDFASNGILSPEQWSRIQEERSKTGESITAILSRLGLANENLVKNALELQYGVNYLPLSKIETPVSECLQLLPQDVMRQHQLVPVLKDDKRITIAMVNPNNLVALDEIKMRLMGTQVRVAVCTEEDFESFMESNYANQPKS